MKLAYQYKLRPDKEQKLLLNSWLEKLRLQYNYLLRQRFDWWEQNRCSINACPLICYLSELKEQPNFYAQKRSLVQLKQERPWYGDIYSNVLQDMVAKVEKAFNRYIVGDENGKRSGKPRFKNKTRYRSFTYPNSVRLIGEPTNHKTPEIKVRLPMIGDVRMVLHRPIPDGFDIKQAIITHKTDGWHITLIIEDPTVPDAPVSVLEEISVIQDNSLGIDVGIEYFCYPSEGEPVPSPLNYRKSEKKPSLAFLEKKTSFLINLKGVVD